MKKKIILIIVSLILFVCLFPVPKKIDVKTENASVQGVFFDFLVLDDKFVGKAMMNGLEYEPFNDYSAYKFNDASGLYYIIRVVRYDSVTNTHEMKAFYILVNWIDSTLQLVKITDVPREI